MRNEVKLPKNGTRRIIHINQGAIRSNSKHNSNNPVITCKTHNRKRGSGDFCVSHSDNHYGHILIIRDDVGKEVARVVYSRDKPQPCGAKVWIETLNHVELIRED